MPNVTEIYNSLIDDPDIVPPENVSKEQYVALLAEQRVKQYENNEKALNLGLSKGLKYNNGHNSAITQLSAFLTKANGDDSEEGLNERIRDIKDLIEGGDKLSPTEHDEYLEWLDEQDDQDLTPEDINFRDNSRNYAEYIEPSPVESGVPPAAFEAMGINPDNISNDAKKLFNQAIENVEQETDNEESNTDEDNFKKMTADMIASAKKEFREVFTDNGFKDYVKQVHAMGGNFEGIKNKSDAQNHISEIAKDLIGDKKHPHAAIVENLIKNENYNTPMKAAYTEFSQYGKGDSGVGDGKQQPKKKTKKKKGSTNKGSGKTNKPKKTEGKKVPPAQPEGKIDAEVGEPWHTVIDPARAGGIRYGLMHGLINKKGNITPVGKKFFDGISGMYDDAREHINNNPEGYKKIRLDRNFKTWRNPIRDDHRLSATALSLLIAQYNAIGGSEGAGKLVEVNNIPAGVTGTSLLNNDDVIPIEGAESPNIDDMHVNNLNHHHVVNAVIWNRDEGEDGEDYSRNMVKFQAEFIKGNLEDREVPEDDAEKIADQAQKTVGKKVEEEGKNLSDGEVQLDMFNNVVDEAFKIAANKWLTETQGISPPLSEERWQSGPLADLVNPKKLREYQQLALNPGTAAPTPDPKPAAEAAEVAEKPKDQKESKANQAANQEAEQEVRITSLINNNPDYIKELHAEEHGDGSDYSLEEFKEDLAEKYKDMGYREARRVLSVDKNKKKQLKQKEIEKQKAKEEEKRVKEAEKRDAAKQKAVEAKGVNREKLIDKFAKETGLSADDIREHIDDLNFSDQQVEDFLKGKANELFNTKVQEAQKNRNLAAARTREKAEEGLKAFKSPEEYRKDKQNNPDGDTMSAEHATDEARKVLAFWHENKEHLKNSELHNLINTKMADYIDAGANFDELEKELSEMERQGILGDPDKMQEFHDKNALDKKTERAKGDAHQHKLTQAIESAHADRSADENGKGIHNRMDHVGEHEQVSSEDAGIEYSDSETPHLGVLNDKGEIDEEAQRLYNVLHGAKLNIKNVPSEAIEQANKLDQEHANRISEKKKTSQERLEEIEKDKDTAIEQNNKDRDKAFDSLDRVTAQTTKSLKDEYDSSVEAQNSNHDERQNYLDSLNDEYSETLDKHVAAYDAAHNTHTEDTKRISELKSKNLKAISEDAAALKEEASRKYMEDLKATDERHQKDLKTRAEQRDQELAVNDEAIQKNRDSHKESTARMLEANQTMTDNLEAIAKRHQTELDMHQGDEASLKELKEKQAAEYGEMRDNFQTKIDEYQEQVSDYDNTLKGLEENKKGSEHMYEQYKARRENAKSQEIKDLIENRDNVYQSIVAEERHRSGLQSKKMNGELDLIDKTRDNALNDANKAKQAVEEEHLKAINYLREERGEKPLTGKQDIEKQLNIERGMATEIHQQQLSDMLDEHTQAKNTLNQRHETSQQVIKGEHKKKETAINDVAKVNHKANDEDYNGLVSDSHKIRDEGHAKLKELVLDYEGAKGQERVKTAETNLRNYMKKLGIDDSIIENAIAHKNLGKSAADNKDNFNQENEADHSDTEKLGGKPTPTEEEQRDGKKGQTRTIPDPATDGKTQKKQIWVPGRGKGWIDADKLDGKNEATANNMKAADGEGGGKMIIYPKGAEGNPFDGAMAGHGGNWHSIETDNLFDSDHPEYGGLSGEDFIAHHLGNKLKDHEGMKGNVPFEVNASEHGFGMSEHPAVNRRKPKKDGWFGEQAQARAAYTSEGKEFKGALDWLQRVGKNIKPGLGRLAEASREARHDYTYKKKFKPDKQGRASAMSEAFRYIPHKLKPKKIRRLHERQDKRDKASAVAKLREHTRKQDEELDKY